jgi:tetratricopeptide (TPR) repeat protein/streptogramin lyase
MTSISNSMVFSTSLIIISTSSSVIQKWLIYSQHGYILGEFILSKDDMTIMIISFNNNNRNSTVGAMIPCSFSVILLLISSIFSSYFSIGSAFAQVFANTGPRPNDNNTGASAAAASPTPADNANQAEYLSYATQGANLFKSGNYQGALTAFDNAIAIDPNHYTSWNNRGLVLDKLGRNNDAIASFNKAISLNDTTASIWGSLGTSLYKMGRYSEAITAYDKAISLDPNNTAYQQNKDITLKSLATQPKLSSSNQANKSPSTNALTQSAVNLTAPNGNMTSSNSVLGSSTPSNQQTNNVKASQYSFVREWYSGNPRQFIDLGYIAVDSSGNVYVTQIGVNEKVQKFDSSGNFITEWGSAGHGDGQFSAVAGIAVDSSGNVYVVDSSGFKGNGNRIEKFDSSGNFITKWGTTGHGDGQFKSPLGIAVDSSGNVYVADRGNHRIQKFDSSGNFITKWGSYGLADGQFQNPYAVGVDSSGNVYVNDFVLGKIQKFDSSGNFITEWGSVGTGDGQMRGVYSIAVDSSGNVYVADSKNGRIQKFDSSGNFITKWGSGYYQPHTSPGYLAVGSSGNVYVTEFANKRITVFAPSG